MNINKINPATLKITDMRFADIDGAPKRRTVRSTRSRCAARRLSFSQRRTAIRESTSQKPGSTTWRSTTKEWDKEWSNDRRWS
ncbi:MAG: hypothetical protein IJG18_06070 [Kiritimatiellae bacterium]|nr:hypothetical protein [Kiritimatiellia bacterium]